MFIEGDRNFDANDFRMSLEILSKMRQHNEIDMTFRNITKIQFGTYFHQRNGVYEFFFQSFRQIRRIYSLFITCNLRILVVNVEDFIWNIT